MLAPHKQTRIVLSALLATLALSLGACGAPSSLPHENAQEAAAVHLLQLMDERLAVAPLVAKSKWNSGAAIDDPVRERQLLDDIVQRARGEQLDPALAQDFFQSQFDAGKIVQTRLHALWRQQQLGLFNDAPDLARDVRPVLDRLTPELIATLKSLQAHLCDADIQRLLAPRSAPLFSREWDQATRDRALAPLHCPRQAG